MIQVTEKHVYAGGNTSLGFYSLYDNVAAPDSRRIFIVKGGPGVGKSTLMKQVGNRMQDMGYVVEYFHCSSDCNSLDGVRVPKLEIAFIDGTAPHIVDPRNPGAVDEILHLGDFWDEAGIVSHKAELMATNQAVGENFRRAYRFLAAAKSVYDDIEIANQEKFNYGRANGVAASLILSILGHRPVSSDVGRARHLFASALTPEGPCNFLDNLLEPIEHKYVLQGAPGTGKSTVVKKIVDAAVERGFYVEAFHCGFDPIKYEHAFIPALRTAVVTSAPPHVIDTHEAVTINMDLFRNAAAVQTNAARIAEDTTIYTELLEVAVNSLAAAKKLHDRLEEFYVPYMDFAGIEALRDDVISRVMSYAEASQAV